MGFTLLSDCSFQIGLDSSDFSFLFQAQETRGGTRCTELGSFSRRSTKYPVLLSFSTLSIKQNRLAVAERNLMEFVKPAVSCPIECNRLLVCVRISCGFRRACPRATASRLSELLQLLMQAVLPRAPASGLLLPRAPAAPTSRCRSDGPWDCSVQRQQWSWWPAAVACAVQHSLTVTGTDSRDDSDGRFLTVLSIYVGPGQQTITGRNLK